MIKNCLGNVGENFPREGPMAAANSYDVFPVTGFSDLFSPVTVT